MDQNCGVGLIPYDTFFFLAEYPMILVFILKHMLLRYSLLMTKVSWTGKSSGLDRLTMLSLMILRSVKIWPSNLIYTLLAWLPSKRIHECIKLTFGELSKPQRVLVAA